MLTHSKHGVSREFNEAEFVYSLRHVIIDIIMTQLRESGIRDYNQIAVWKFDSMMRGYYHET